MNPKRWLLLIALALFFSYSCETIVLVDSEQPAPTGEQAEQTPGPITVPEIPEQAQKETDGFNYAEALQLSLYFYDAEKSGPGITGGRLTWRGDSELVDMTLPLHAKLPNDMDATNMSQAFINANIAVLDPDGDGSVDVSGGYHDAGDHVKFGLPQTYSSSTLEWSLYEFKDAFVQIGEYEHMMELLRWFSDYYLRCTFRNEAGDVIAFCYQVGEGTVDHIVWAPPELIDHETYPRPAYFATAETPASDQAAGAAASLAISYINNLKDDPAYARKCIDAAIALYTFAVKYRGIGYDGGFYNSASDEDELAWAAVWLNIATGEAKYIEDITSQDAQGMYTGWMKKILRSTQDEWQNGWVHCWDSKWGGVFAKLAPITNDPTHWEYFRWNLEYWANVEHKNSGDSTYLAQTAAGFSFINGWGSARYNAAAQFQGMVYKKYTGSNEFDVWMTRQIQYIMGDNPLNCSYIVGYSDNYVQHPHHRAAHGSPINDMSYPPEHKHILWGALASGPINLKDEHNDETDDYGSNEVAIDYNAGLVGALAGHYTYFGKGHQPRSNFPPADPPLEEYWVKAKINQIDDRSSQVTIQVTNESAFPPCIEKQFAVRYYFNISELFPYNQSISAVKLAGYNYDENESVYNQPKLVSKGPLPYDTEKGLYYMEFTWPESGFYGSREYQFTLECAQDATWQNRFDASNDYSLQGLSDEYSKTDKIELFVDGEKISGVAP